MGNLILPNGHQPILSPIQPQVMIGVANMQGHVVIVISRGAEQLPIPLTPAGWRKLAEEGNKIADAIDPPAAIEPHPELEIVEPT